ncbi:hypothetical protein [Corynebacterium freiburgense]|uniref:hypothetical protein n=1 Tax=Corynebacterium freiburgense TaxID=556548 RepID=UPI00040A7829|nr:hypothetical protein [Corynebacterium freiburgense]WJZ01843.1 hypothetical protein CFREI_02695 [Corynebacterium freiburgense]
MFANFRRRALTAGMTALTAGAILIPNAAAADLSAEINNAFTSFLYIVLSYLYWIPAGISMELGIFDLLNTISG